MRLPTILFYLYYLLYRERANLLGVGFKGGFRLSLIKSPFSYFKSAHQHLSRVSEKLWKEVALGQIAGPFISLPFLDFIVFWFLESSPRSSQINVFPSFIFPTPLKIRYAQSFILVINTPIQNKSGIESPDPQSLPVHQDSISMLGYFSHNVFFA